MVFFFSIIQNIIAMTAHDTTSIRMLPQKLFKADCCCVCGMPAILKWRDLELGDFGDCCYEASIRADFCLRGFTRPKLSQK